MPPPQPIYHLTWATKSASVGSPHNCPGVLSVEPRLVSLALALKGENPRQLCAHLRLARVRVVAGLRVYTNAAGLPEGWHSSPRTVPLGRSFPQTEMKRYSETK